MAGMTADITMAMDAADERPGAARIRVRAHTKKD
jgi:hypothetical protein